MRILPSISQPTLDSFRKDVYRNRLALCFLILLLGGKGARESKRSTIDLAGNPTSIQSNAEYNRPDKGTAKGNNLNLMTSPFLFLKQYNIWSPDRRSLIEEDDLGTSIAFEKDFEKPSKMTISKGHKSKRKASSLPISSTSSSPLSPASLFQYPKLAGVQLLWQSDALTTIARLHILWAVRLGGMMMEDSIAKVSKLSDT
jgi:hypothetical protein